MVKGENLSLFPQQLNGIEQSPQGYHFHLPLYQSYPLGPPHIAYPDPIPQCHKLCQEKYITQTKVIKEIK